ncbi:hypothetical protein RYG35_001601 [Vibrio parahaemolyticus]|nr:hypothetical protein [Vibrio parahaemolyticus]ELM4049845.1 hypothetical protein [Vibrio parahaemolyticus]
MISKDIERRFQLETKFYLGLWEHKDGDEYGYLLTGNHVWLTPESYLSY